MNILVKVIILDGCVVCDFLTGILNEVHRQDCYNNVMQIDVVKISNRVDLSKIGLNIKLFPTLLAYKNNKLRLGWEGFAALAPDEIKREMVEDVLRQVAALADECDGEPNEKPQ